MGNGAQGASSLLGSVVSEGDGFVQIGEFLGTDQDGGRFAVVGDRDPGAGTSGTADQVVQPGPSLGEDTPSVMAGTVRGVSSPSSDSLPSLGRPP